MSGHSKWHNIAVKKGKTDAARGKIFTKIGREIAIAVREGGSNPESNSKLRDVIAKAKSNNMPNDNIKRSIQKASGELGNVDYETITYEGYAPGGVAVIVETITDNRNRTASDVRHCFAKYDGTLGVTGSVGFMFDKKGVLVVERTADTDEDEMMMTVLDAGAEDMKTLDDAFEIYTDPNEFSAVREQPGKGRPDLPERRSADGAPEHRCSARRRDPHQGTEAAGHAGRQRRRAERLAQRRAP